MVNCQAFGCNNDSRKGAGKTFYIISNPKKYPEKSELIARWNWLDFEDFQIYSCQERQVMSKSMCSITQSTS